MTEPEDAYAEVLANTRMELVMANEAYFEAESYIRSLIEAAGRFERHVREVSCDHDSSAGTHHSCPEALRLDAVLSGRLVPTWGMAR